MIKHVVVFKFKPETDERERTAVINELRDLPNKIDVIREYEVGLDVLRSQRSWDGVIIGTYDDLDALQKYQRHDDHIPVVMKMQQLCDTFGVVDFEF